MKILLIDNYDSFTYNLVDYLGRLGAELEVVRNDEFDLAGLELGRYQGVVISPGPSTPPNAGLLMPFIDAHIERIPILGVCLGFQAIGLHFGADLIESPVPFHGKRTEIICAAHPMYKGIPATHKVGRYHSLCLRNLPDILEVTAQTLDGLVMSFSHRALPVWGVQYHPESILTEHGLIFLNNWLQFIKERGE